MEFIQDFMGEKRKREVITHTLQLTAWKFLMSLLQIPLSGQVTSKTACPDRVSLIAPLFHYRYPSSLEDGGCYKHQQKFLLHK